MKITTKELKQIIVEEVGLQTTRHNEEVVDLLNQIEYAGMGINKDAAWETISRLIKSFKASDAGKELYRRGEQ